jgi:sigma-B regulation protein RsbU (phosphoserine phosphatase)
MMMTQTAIATLVNADPNRTPSDVFVHTNRVIRDNVSRLGGHRYMTLNVIRLEDDKLVVAGKHQDFFVWRAKTGAVEIVTNEGPWIGVVDDVRRSVEDQTIALEVGDWVLLHTDGLTEAANASGVMFGEAGLRRVLAEIAGKVPLREAVKLVRARVEAYQQRQDDDLTLVMLRRVT